MVCGTHMGTIIDGAADRWWKGVDGKVWEKMREEMDWEIYRKLYEGKDRKICEKLRKIV
jgi:hypothetical protein